MGMGGEAPSPLIKRTLSCCTEYLFLILLRSDPKNAAAGASDFAGGLEQTPIAHLRHLQGILTLLSLFFLLGCDPVFSFRLISFRWIGGLASERLQRRPLLRRELSGLAGKKVWPREICGIFTAKLNDATPINALLDNALFEFA